MSSVVKSLTGMLEVKLFDVGCVATEDSGLWMLPEYVVWLAL